MKLTRLYSNKPEIFAPIEFRSGLSVILAEIRLPENQNRNVHNLGKSTVGLLIDFCLLKGKSKEFFLFKHEELFEGFVFYLEIEADSGAYITVSRSLESRDAISLLVSGESIADASAMAPADWSHLGLGFASAKTLLDGLLGITAATPWDYRSLMGYVLREQADYGDVFHLKKFRGKQSEWKPFLAHVLGFDSASSTRLYETIADVDRIDRDMIFLSRESGGPGDADVTTIDGLLAIRGREAAELEATLESFDFSKVDSEANRELVESVETQIAYLNEESYRLMNLLAKLGESLAQDRIFFTTEEAATLFAQAGVAFAGQLKKDYDQLLEFNRSITEER